MDIWRTTNMNPYITFKDKDVKGVLQYYILQREFPHFLGIVSSVPMAGTWQSPISAHQMWIVFAGTLRGNMVPGYNNISDEIQVVLDAMAAWFYSERILPDEKRYKKFKIATNDTVRN